MGLGSEIRDPEKTYPGSRGQKGPRSRRIRNTAMHAREDWIIYRGPSLLEVVCFGVPRPPPLPSGKCLSFSVFLFFVSLAYWRVTGEGGGLWSWVIRPQENLFLNKSFNPLWCMPTKWNSCCIPGCWTCGFCRVVWIWISEDNNDQNRKKKRDEIFEDVKVSLHG